MIEIIIDYRKGFSLRQLADKHNYSHEHVRRILIGANVYKRTPEECDVCINELMSSLDMLITDIAAKLEVSPKTVYRMIKAYRL